MLRRVPLLRGAAIFVSAFAAACHLRCHMHAAAATRIQNRPSNATGAGGALTTGALFLSNIPRNVAEWISNTSTAKPSSKMEPPLRRYAMSTVSWCRGVSAAAVSKAK